MYIGIGTQVVREKLIHVYSIATVIRRVRIYIYLPNIIS